MENPETATAPVVSEVKQTDPQSIQTPPPPKPRPFFIGLVLILFGVLIGIFVSRFLPMPGTSVTPAVTPTPIATADPTADWKTYTTKTFSFQYPNSLSVEKFENGEVIFTNRKGDPESVWLKLVVIPNKQNLTPVKYAQSKLCSDRINPNYNEPDRQEIITYCQKNIKTESLNKPGLNGVTTNYNFYENPISSTLIAGVNDFILFESTGETGNEASELSTLTLDQILSTFKFTDISQKVSLVCINRDLGLQFTLPNDTWKCDSKDESGAGWITLTSPVFTIYVSSLGRGPYCSAEQDPSHYCAITPFLLNNKYNLSLYTYKNIDQEIWGTLIDRQGQSNTWISIEYLGMDRQKLNTSSKSELNQLMSSFTITP